ncbi:radical SAM superfamily protein [Colletotrichum sp. SAR 10_86]|nr:radical SAM superfamily protein [Colletotrichum sp. SAR 10_76]KAI8237691.1 radical SAM superfamily protein [Colletotrichum sp. SAR 10_86]
MHTFKILFCFALSLLLPYSSALHITNQTIDKFLLDEYDYVVVGGGLSGLVVANRLSENSDATVLVIEAGDLDRREGRVIIPGYIGRTPPSGYGQDVLTAPQTFLDGKTRDINQGKVVGGGSVVNGMCWTRGAAADFDAWEELGNDGWGWDGLLPYFKKVERYTTNVGQGIREEFNIKPNMSFHGTDGPINVAYPEHIYNTSSSVLQGLAEVGIHTSNDVNSGDPTGAMIVASSMSPTNQTRSDARTGYFDTANARSNFHVVTGHMATRLIVGLPGSLTNQESRRIIGVEVSRSPLTTPLINTVAFPALKHHANEWRTLLAHSKNQSFDFLPLDTPSAVAAGYAKQKTLVLNHLAREDVGAYELLAASWGQISIANQKPLSRGTVRPSSSSVYDAPVVDPRYCADPLDCKIIRLGLQLTQKLMATDAMRPLLPVVDAKYNSTDERELMTALKPLVGTEYHPSGTTSMLLKDLGGVVDSELMVYGTCNLRIVDAGIMPMIPGGHIQAAVYAVAEKAADIIKAAADGASCPMGQPQWPVGQGPVGGDGQSA